MRVLLVSSHRHKGGIDEGAGKKPRAWPSGSGNHIHDLLARGLAETGHRVFYLLLGGAEGPLPPGVEAVRRPQPDVDVAHCMTNLDPETRAAIERLGVPWVTTCHLDPTVRGLPQVPAEDNWIFVSRTLAASFGKERFVHNGLDPSAYDLDTAGGDYLLFMSSLDWADEKGLDTALAVSSRTSLPLIVAGTSRSERVITETDERCLRAGATLVGDVRGKRKAALLAGARALLFPTRVNEGFGLVMVEALLSGTPVICSDRGACPEIISEEVGFVCRDEADYLGALSEVGAISRRRCREWARARYDYQRMVRDYLDEYERELAGWTGG